MKKTILGLAFLTMLGTSFTSFAQTQSQECNKKECVKKECKDNKDCKDKKDCCKGKKDGKFKQQRDKGAKQAALFEGIVLSDAQQAKIKALNEGMRLSRQEMVKAQKDSKIAKADVQKDSKEAKAEALKQSKEARAKMHQAKNELRAKYLKDMSEILDSDQYVKFLQNYFINNPSHRAVAHGPKGVKGAKGIKGGKGMKGFQGRPGAKAPQANS